MNPLLRTLIAPVLLTLALGLVGCSGDEPEPQFADPTSEASSEAPTPSPTETTEKPLSQAAVIDAFFGEFSKSISTGDPDTFMRYAAKDCEGCLILRKNLKGAYANGGYVKGGRWEVLGANPRNGDESMVWDVRIDTARERWLDASGDVVKIVNPSIQGIAVYMGRTKGGFVVADIKIR